MKNYYIIIILLKCYFILIKGRVVNCNHFLQSEEFNNKSSTLLDWLAGSERLLRFQGSPPDDPIEVEQQILEHSVSVKPCLN